MPRAQPPRVRIVLSAGTHSWHRSRGGWSLAGRSAPVGSTDTASRSPQGSRARPRDEHRAPPSASSPRSPPSLPKHDSALTVNCDPFVQVFPLRKHDGHAEIAAPERGFGMFQQLVLVRALWNVLLWFEGFGRATTAAKGKEIENLWKGTGARNQWTSHAEARD